MEAAIVIDEARQKMKNEFVSALEKVDKFQAQGVALLFEKWAGYDQLKTDYLFGLIQACETHLQNCSFRKMEGNDFFQKADNYVKERTKIAKWVIGLISSFVIAILCFLIGLYLNKITNIEKIVVRMDKDLSVAVKQIETNTKRLDIVERKVFLQ